ncbi:MAG: class I SAM-dependent methyltransferase [Polyangiaceae bacterium]|nr:class I SAM-dependent methyltransferase [Polyangiaceae bacterium]MCB9605778.1 class I SAM-dependent methyltransferase [Polyangiaceae bacterium]
MDWRLKAAFFWGFNYVPMGAELHYFAQRRLTKGLPRKLTPLSDVANSYMLHPRVLKGAFPEFPKGHQLEFGAGRDLFGNLITWCCGVDRQTVIDIDPLLKPELINHVISTLKANPLPGFEREPPRKLSHRHFLRELREVYGIDYIAPGDARDVDMADGSIDMVITTNTLEHIPRADIAKILKECYRLLRVDGVLSQVIDYSDHYSHGDGKLNDYSFLAHSERVWKRFNPPDHYQNRLRHVDYRKLIEEAGFNIEIDRPRQPTNAEELLAQVKLDKSFASYPLEDILPTAGHFVAFKRGQADGGQSN